MKKLMFLSTTPDERLDMALKEAGEAGYKTVFCGKHDFDPARKAVDAFYVTDWEDTEELVRIGRKEKINGIIPLCDPCVLPAARVAQALGLPGNTPESVEKLLSKEDFRSLQRESGVFCPANVVSGSYENLLENIQSLHFPVILKPMFCSSSHGMTVIREASDFSEAFLEASKYSRNGMVCAEEFIENDSLRIIEADVFVVGSHILWDGVRFCYRLESAPLRPAYDVYPVSMTEEEREEFCRTVENVLKTAGVSLGEFNVEGFFTQEGKFFIVEINPRQAGHYNPQDIQLYCGVNLTKLLITTAAGDMDYYRELEDFPRTSNYILSYSVFSEKEGILDHIHISPSIRSEIMAYRFLHGQKEGDFVKDIITAVRPIAKVVFQFESQQRLESVRSRISDLVYPVLKE